MPFTDNASLNCSTVLPDYILQSLSDSQIANIDKCANDFMLTIKAAYDRTVYPTAQAVSAKRFKRFKRLDSNTQFNESIEALKFYLNKAYARDNDKFSRKTTDPTRYDRVRELLILIKTYDAVWLDQASNESPDPDALLKSTLTAITLKCVEIDNALQHKKTSRLKKCVETILHEAEHSVSDRLETLQELPRGEVEYLAALGKKVQFEKLGIQKEKELLSQLEAVGIGDSVSLSSQNKSESLLKQYQDVERAIQAVKGVKVTEETARGEAWAKLVVALSVEDLKPFFSEEKRWAATLFAGIVRIDQSTDYSKSQDANNEIYNNAVAYFDSHQQPDAKSFSRETRQDLIEALALSSVFSVGGDEGEADVTLGQQLLNTLEKETAKVKEAIELQKKDRYRETDRFSEFEMQERVEQKFSAFNQAVDEQKTQLRKSVEAVPKATSVILQKGYHEKMARRLVAAKEQAEPLDFNLKLTKDRYDAALKKAQANDTVLKLIAEKENKIQQVQYQINEGVRRYESRLSQYNFHTAEICFSSYGASPSRVNFHPEESGLSSDFMAASQNLIEQYEKVTDEFAGLSQEWDIKIKELRANKTQKMQAVFSNKAEEFKAKIKNFIEEFNDGKNKITNAKMLDRLNSIKVGIDSLQPKAEAWATLLDTDQANIFPVDKQQVLDLAWSGLCKKFKAKADAKGPIAQVFSRLAAEQDKLLSELKSKCDENGSLSAENFIGIYEENQRIAQLGCGDALIRVLGPDRESVSKSYEEKKKAFDLALAAAAIACHKSLMVHAGTVSFYQKLKENITKVAPDVSDVLTNDDLQVWREFDEAIIGLWSAGGHGSDRNSCLVDPKTLYLHCKKIGGYYQRIGRVATKLEHSGYPGGQIVAWCINFFRKICRKIFNSNKSVFSLKAPKERSTDIAHTENDRKRRVTTVGDLNRGSNVTGDAAKTRVMPDVNRLGRAQQAQQAQQRLLQRGVPSMRAGFGRGGAAFFAERMMDEADQALVALRETPLVLAGC